MKMLMMNLLESLQNLNNSSPFFLSSLVAIFLIILFSSYKSSWSNFSTSSSSINSPPCASKLPIIGNLHQLGIHPHRSLASLSQLHGPLMLLRFGTVPVLVVSSSSAAREVMKTQDLAFSDRPKSIIAEKLLYNHKDVAFARYGKYWRQVKSISIVNLLNNKRVRSFRHVREEEIASMVEKIESSSSKVVNLSAMFMRLTNDVVCRVALGKKYWSSCTDLMKGGRNFKEVLKDFGELLGMFSIGDFIPWLAWLDGLNGLNAKLDKVAKELDVFLDRVIQEHQDGDRESSSEIDFVDVLLEIQRENLLGFPLEMISIKALILDMFAAGTDTTYTVLEWAMSELIRDPSIMRKLQNEVRGIVGNKSHVTENDLTNMKYLKAVIKETLRLHPPIPLVPRKSTQDVKLSNYDIKANTLVMVNAWMIGRDSKSYKNPDRFDPERFLSANSGINYKGNDFELIPFGAGRRICPGIQFAMAINEIALANLVYKFNWEMPVEVKFDDLDMSEAIGLNIHRKLPLEVVAIPYSVVET